MLVGRRLEGEQSWRQAAREIHQMGARHVVIKGGHASGDSVDLLFDGSDFSRFPGSRLKTRSDHGTGCTFAAAVTALLAKDSSVPAAVAAAKEFVRNAMLQAPEIGKGHGPVDHFFMFRNR